MIFYTTSVLMHTVVLMTLILKIYIQIKMKEGLELWSSERAQHSKFESQEGAQHSKSERPEGVQHSEFEWPEGWELIKKREEGILDLRSPRNEIPQYQSEDDRLAAEDDV